MAFFSQAPVVEAALQVPFTLSNMRQGLLPDLVSQFAVMQKADDEGGTRFDSIHGTRCSGIIAHWWGA